MESISRKQIFGIAPEVSGYGIAALVPTFCLPAMEFEITPEIVPAENTSMFGSTHEVNDMANTYRRCNFTASVKLNEDQLPLFFKQNFTVSSTTVSGESAVYEHTLTYDNTNTGTSFTLFRQDDDRGSQYVAGAKFNTITVTPEKGQYVMLELEGVGQFPAEWSGTVTNSYHKEFTSNHVVFSYVPEGSGYTTTDGLLAATLNHEFNLTAEEDNYDLGSQDMDQLFTGATRFNAELTTRLASRYSGDTTYEDFVAGNYRSSRMQFLDTTRFVTGSVASTNPQIRFEYPSCFVRDYAEEGSANDILKQTFTLEALDKVGVSNTPMQIVVVNATVSY